MLLVVAALYSGAHRATCSTDYGDGIDRPSLLDFKKSISLDPYGALASWNHSIHFCQWKGVSCRNEKHPDRATALDLADQGLVGFISPSLGNLTLLTVLNLSQNSFTGRIPPSLGHLHILKFLIMGNNTLQGRIPNELANCTGLRAVYLSSNQLVGEIPTEVTSLSQLRSLDLEGRIPNELGQLSRLTLLALGRNKLSGRIPQSVFNLSSLEILSLEGNYLSMPYLPSNIGTTLHNLQMLYLDYNQIGGPIPPSFSNASRLVDIDLSFNSFAGHVPTTLGGLGKLSWLNLEGNHIEANDKQSWMFMDALTNCSSLNVLALFQNQLEGKLPGFVGNLSSRLQYLLLGQNELSGSVPSSIGNLQGLTSLGLDSNNFDGTITEWIGNFRNMEKLFLESNKFVGPVPPSLGNLSRLWYLALKSNKFEGFVPATIGQLQHLQILDISDNHLNGTMPVDLFSLPALISFNLSHNYLHGTLPMEIGNAKQIIEIDISSSKIYGKIPQTLGDCESLESIVMDNNFLQGNIPSSLRNLKSLKMLNLSRNNLSGPVPGFLGSLQFLSQLDLSYNNLQGEIPRNGVFANATALTLAGNHNLCGGVPELHLPPCPVVVPSRRRRLSHSLKILILVACPMLILVLLVSVLLFHRKKSEQKSLLVPSVLDKHLPQVSYMDLAKATDNFSPPHRTLSSRLPSLPLPPPATTPANGALLHTARRPMAAALASSPLVHLTASGLRLPRPRASAPASSCPRWGCSRGVCLDWRLKVRLRAPRRCDRMRCFSIDGGGDDGEKRGEEEAAEAKVEGAEELGSERSRSGSFSSSSSSSSGTPGVPNEPPLLSFSVDNIDTVKLLELLGPEKVDPADVKAIKEKLFGYTTFWLTKEEPFGDLGEGVLFIGNLRGKREEIFAKLQRQLCELTGDKYNLFMVEEPNSEGEDPRGGPRVSFGLLRREVSEPGPTTLWQYVISLLLFLLTVFSCVELGIASKISSLPPEIVTYFTDPNATGPPPDMQLLLPFVESALPVAYGVLAIQLFHEVGHFLAAFPKKVKLSIPFFIPNFTLGTFGAITQFKSILPDRKTMFDISMAGPLAGAALSFSMFFVGLLLSSNPAGASDLVQVPSKLFQGSLLLGLVSRATLGYRAMHAATVSIHPLVIVGWCGLTTTAFNMLPVGCLDGGRALQGAFGKDALFGFGLTTYSLLGLGVLGGPLSLPWGLYVLICQRTPEKPCLNDVSDVGTWRRAALIVSVFLVLLTLIPLWDELAEDLGVGLVTSF